MNSSKLPRVREGQRNPACCILLGGRVGHDLVTEQQQHTIFSLVESSIPNHGYRGMAISEKGYKLNWTAQSTCTPNPHDIQGLAEYKSSTSYLVDSTFEELDIQSLPTLHQLHQL